MDLYVSNIFSLLLGAIGSLGTAYTAYQNFESILRFTLEVKWSPLFGKYRFKWLSLSKNQNKGALTRKILSTSNISTDANQNLLDTLQSFRSTDEFDSAFICRAFLGQMNVFYHAPMTTNSSSVAWQVMEEFLRLQKISAPPPFTNATDQDRTESFQVPKTTSSAAILRAHSILEEVASLHVSANGPVDTDTAKICCVDLITHLMTENKNLTIPRFLSAKETAILSMIAKWSAGVSGSRSNSMFIELYEQRDESTYTPLHSL
jgi:hypothetical protein